MKLQSCRETNMSICSNPRGMTKFDRQVDRRKPRQIIGSYMKMGMNYEKVTDIRATSSRVTRFVIIWHKDNSVMMRRMSMN